MQFKVGDRVEAIKPPNRVEEREADQIGLGHIVATNPDGQFGETHTVKLDSGNEWYYSEDRLRPAAPPTPSITVGTQVRLTGVVKGPTHKETGAVGIAIDGCPGGFSNTVLVLPARLEVIRQPFKRGEVVWSCGAVATGEQYVVFNDETNGRVDVVHCLTGTATTDNDISRFERRP